MADHPFTDPITQQVVTLRVPDHGRAVVLHGDCPTPADVTLELDAFYCPTCRWNGRVSGAWATSRVNADRWDPDPDPARCGPSSSSSTAPEHAGRPARPTTDPTPRYPIR